MYFLLLHIYRYLQGTNEQGVVVHIYNSCTWEAELEDKEIEASLWYIVSKRKRKRETKKKERKEGGGKGGREEGRDER
jgi:hypothetical protein